MAATIVYMLSLTFVLFSPFCGLFGASSTQIKTQRTKRDTKFLGSVHFNNPKLLNEKLKGYRNGYYYDTRQDPVDNVNRMGGIYIQQEANRLAFRLRILSDEEMRVPSLQNVYDSLDYREAEEYTQDTVNEVAKDIENKIVKYIRMLKINKQTVELHKMHMRKAVTNRHECCNLHNTQLRYDENYNCEISKKYSCDLIPPSVPKGAFNPGRNLTEVFQQAYHIVPSIKWQYFISTQGVHTEYPAHNFNGATTETCRNAHDTRHRDIYVSTVHPPSKRVVIMVDHGNSLSPNQLKIAKAVSKHILASLTENDWVGMFGVSSEVVYPRKDNCVNRTLVRVTSENRAQFSRFIDQLQKKELPVDHSMGFSKAFDLIGNHSLTQTSEQDYLIIYVSRGLMSSLTDSKVVLQTIQQRNLQLGHKVVINTFAVIDDGKPIMYEKNFMENIADQTLTGGAEYDQKARNGLMRSVNTTRDLSSIIGDFYQPFNTTVPDTSRIFLPQFDEVAGGVVLSVTWPCFHNGVQLLGIVGLDVHLSEVVEKLTYFNKQSGVQAFMLSTKGYMITHPSMTRPFLAKQPPVWTDISHYETVPRFDSVRSKILGYNLQLCTNSHMY